MSSDSKYHYFTITADAMPTEGHTKGKVLLDGMELKGVRGIEVKTWYNKVTEVTVTFIAGATLAIEDIKVVDDAADTD